MFNKTIIATSIALLSGCATMFDGSTQSLAITTANDKAPEKTTCNIINEEGSWQTMGGNSMTTIHRDGNTMTIKCDNPYQGGLSTLEPNFSGGYLVLDLFTAWGIGLFVDAGTNALYSYPSMAIVGMMDKSGVIMPPSKLVLPITAPAVENNININNYPNASKVDVNEQTIGGSKETIVESSEYFIGKKGKCYTLKNGRQISVNKSLCQ